jgi:hypothetical protein
MASPTKSPARVGPTKLMLVLVYADASLIACPKRVLGSHIIAPRCPMRGVALGSMAYGLRRLHDDHC